jgi:hypothetical protein
MDEAERLAAISCLEMPYGTALGVFTLMVLSRPSVQRLFSSASWSADSSVKP